MNTESWGSGCKARMAREKLSSDARTSPVSGVRPKNGQTAHLGSLCNTLGCTLNLKT